MAFVTDVRDATGRACRASDPIRLKAVIDRVIDWAEDAQKGEGGDRKKKMPPAIGEAMSLPPLSGRPSDPESEPPGGGRGG